MEQTAFAMKLKPGAIGKHRRRHDKTRPEGLKANTLAPAPPRIPHGLN